MTAEQAERLLYDWPTWARAKQIAPDGDWATWLILAGRGFGKTRTGAEWIRAEIESGKVSRVALVAPTAADARDTMVEGESGILAIAPPWAKPVYEPSKRRITWPNGARATTFSADEPDRLRGPQHERAWCDELAAWKYPESWDMLQFGLRLGDKPRCVVTTTPKPVRLIRDLIADTSVHVTRGSTYENAVNLAKSFIDAVVKKYEGTRLGRQELFAEVLDDVPGALWTRGMIEELRVNVAPELTRIAIGVDPAVTSGENADETGIVIAAKGTDGHAYVLRDRSCRVSPNDWAQIVASEYRSRLADRVIAEVNNGGDLVESTLRTVDRSISFTAVHASRGKRVRAEPIAALYEQKKVHHVGAEFSDLEDQMCNFVPDITDGSPDRVDALVWVLTELMIVGGEAIGVSSEREPEISRESNALFRGRGGRGR